MRWISIFTLVFTVGLFTDAYAGARAGRADRRESRQGARIHQGVKSGELTAGEAHRLKKQQRRVKGAERRAGADGEISGKEKAHLERMQDRASKNIEAKKHNDKQRGDHAEDGSEAQPQE